MVIKVENSLVFCGSSDLNFHIHHILTANYSEYYKQPSLAGAHSNTAVNRRAKKDHLYIT